MMWKKIIDTNEIQAYEKKTSDYTVRIEARNADGRWDVFKSYHNQKDLNHTIEYTLASRQHLNAFIAKLKASRDLSLEEIRLIKSKKSLNIEVKRAYKELDVEKWYFRVDNEKVQNFVVIRYGEEVEVDIVVHSLYKPYESMIMASLNQIFGLERFSANLISNIYFFDKQSNYKSDASRRELLLGSVEMGFDFS